MSTPVYIPHWGNSTQGTVQVLHKRTETDGRFWQGYVSEMETTGNDYISGGNVLECSSKRDVYVEGIT